MLFIHIPDNYVPMVLPCPHCAGFGTLLRHETVIHYEQPRAQSPGIGQVVTRLIFISVELQRDGLGCPLTNSAHTGNVAIV